MLARGHVNLADTLDYADPTIGALVGLDDGLAATT